MATARQAAPAEAELDVEVEENEVTRSSDLGFSRREVEVEPVTLPKTIDHDGTVQIRMYRTIEEFTYGNPHINYRLEEGKVYRVPVHIASYLHSLGALSNIA